MNVLSCYLLAHMLLWGKGCEGRLVWNTFAKDEHHGPCVALVVGFCSLMIPIILSNVLQKNW